MLKELQKSVWFKLGIVALILLLIYYLRNVLLPFAISFLIAYILDPVVILLQKITKKRFIAVILTLILSVGVFVGIGMFAWPVIKQETFHLYELLQQKDIFNNLSSETPEFIKEYLKVFTQDTSFLEIVKNDSFSTLTNFFQNKILPELGDWFSKTFSAITSILGMGIIILYTIFIMLDYNEISEGTIKLMPKRYEGKFKKFIERFKKEISNYFRGQITIVACVMFLYSIGFKIIGLPMGLLLGIFVGFLNLIPYLQILGFLPALALASIMSLETGTPFWANVGITALVFVSVQIIQDAVLTPKIMGKNTGLNPAMILLSLSVWGKLLGFLGLIVAIPFTCLVRTYYAEYLTLHDQNDSEEDNKSNENQIKTENEKINSN